MTRKPSKAYVIVAPTDWLRIIQAIVIGVCTIITTLGAIKMQRVGDKVDATAVVVQQVKKQTDGTLTAAKKAIAISAQSLATATNKPEDIKSASEAWDAYETQVRNQEKSDEISK